VNACNLPSLATVTQRAAFFDLDRTVIAGSSGVVLSRALRESGVVDGAKLPGEDALYRVYASMGENLPSMVLARQGVVALRGVARHRVIGAAHSVIDDLLNLVLPGAREAIDQHRRDGLRVVLATTTPHDVVAAFARRIGFDDVIATRFQVDEHDCYTGDLVGPFTWSAGKLSAVRTWCDTHEVSLPHSYAYSDSYYDTPLLEAVGHPHAVNPDFRLS
jgi:putative phosphoserine phosphatase/1-acylglycerol-3-phosphate O-acyltransferase